MTKYFQWFILTSITGRPLLSLVLLLAFWWGVDRFTLGILPDPVRWVTRWMRIGKLERELSHNPHDRRARLELADLLVQRRRYRKAIEVLRPNIEAGDHDAHTLFVMGVACLGDGHAEKGELFLREVESLDPRYRLGEVELTRGRFRLRAGNAKGAQEALERFCTIRTGTIEGRVLWAKALAAGGDDAAAALKRDEAWKEYVTAPRFQRRAERLWAWRARPSRPIAYALIALVAAGLFTQYVLPGLAAATQQPAWSAPYPDDEGWAE